MAKGIELPVNVLVIIVIAVLVLIALATLVATGVLSLTPVQVMLEKNTACSQYSCGRGAPYASITVNVQGINTTGTAATISDLCIYDKQCTKNAVTDAAIKKYCGCPPLT